MNDDSPASLKTMDNVMFANGLECKISCKTSKVHTILLGKESYTKDHGQCHICLFHKRY